MSANRPSLPFLITGNSHSEQCSQLHLFTALIICSLTQCKGPFGFVVSAAQLFEGREALKLLPNCLCKLGLR